MLLPPGGVIGGGGGLRTPRLPPDRREGWDWVATTVWSVTQERPRNTHTYELSVGPPRPPFAPGAIRAEGLVGHVRKTRQDLVR